jgi:hypothetical protein
VDKIKPYGKQIMLQLKNKLLNWSKKEEKKVFNRKTIYLRYLIVDKSELSL